MTVQKILDWFARIVVIVVALILIGFGVLRYDESSQWGIAALGAGILILAIRSLLQGRSRTIATWAAVVSLLLFGTTVTDIYSGGYTPRAKVSTGLNLASGAKAAVTEFYRDLGRFPNDNMEAGMPPPEQISGQFVSKLEILPGGKIAVTFGGSEPDRRLVGRILLLEMLGPRSDGHVTWRCRSSSITQRYLPSVCRDEDLPGHRPIIFYLHGRIVEEEGPRPEHPRWGLYDYPAVLAALGRQGAAVVSEQRASGTDMDKYAVEVSTAIDRLLAAEIPANTITVAGFSKGGGIAIRVSSRVPNADIRYAFLAACSEGTEAARGLVPNGHVLSIVETSDNIVGTCKHLAGRNPELGDFREIAISTGKEHGAFYLPRDEWVLPVLEWAHADMQENGK